MSHKAILLSALMIGASSCGDPSEGKQQGTADTCDKLASHFGSYSLRSCRYSDGITYGKYVDDKRDSRYATELDEKHLVLALSENTPDLLDKAGFDTDAPAPIFIDTRLDVIPARELIAARERPTTSKENEWTVGREVVVYFNPKGPGYTVECSTAFKSNGIESVVVSECLPLEDTDEFTWLLREVFDKR